MTVLRVLGFGDNTIDTYVDLGAQFPGGNAVNVAVLMRRLGAEAAYLGCLGEDAAGDLVRGALDAEGVARPRCRDVAGANARAFIAHNAGDRRFIRSERGVRGAWAGFSAEDRAYIAGFDLVHSSIYSELEGELAGLRPSIKRLSFDFSERWSADNLRTIAPLVDFVFLSHPRGDEAACAELARGIAALGPRSVVITRGAAGALALVDGMLTNVRPQPAEVIDTLGAGDAFIAAYLMALLGGADVAGALDAGARHAARACTHLGAFGHGAPWTDLPEPDVTHLKDSPHGLAYRN